VPFSRATTLVADGAVAGRYHGEIGEEWRLTILPQGGIVAAIAARAMAEELAVADQALRSFTCVFAGQVGTGPIEADVQVLRRGRSMSQATVTVRNPGSEAGLTAIAVFGASRPGFSFTDRPFPDGVGAPEQYPSGRDPWPEDVQVERWDPSPFWSEVVENRFVTGHAPWEDYVPESSEQLYWIGFDDPPVGATGTLDPLGLLVLADVMPGSVGERMGNDTPPWFGPSADLTVHLFAPCRSPWVLVRNQARYAGDGYASVDAELWDPTSRGLVGYATQQMFFSFMEGPPTPEQVLPLDQRGAATSPANAS
jgi:acyl-CoA thioesterase